MPKRNLRKKSTEVNDASSREPVAATAAKKGVLSFDVDEEPVVAQPNKKTSRKQGVLKKRLFEDDAHPLPSTQVPSVGDYTAEKLEELKKETKGLLKRPSSVSATPTPPPVLKVSGSFKPIATASSHPPEEAFVRVRPEEHKKKEAVEQPSEDMDKDFVPPNIRTIQMAKAKRERLRQARLAPDYLPLGGASTLLSQDLKQKEDRPRSESDEEEEHMRLQFIGHLPSKPKVAQDELDLDLIEDEDAVDSFVDTQIKKGIAAAGHPDAPRTHRKKQRHYEASVEDDVPVMPVLTRTDLAAAAMQTWQQIVKETKVLQETQDATGRRLKDTRKCLSDARNGLETSKEEEKTIEERYREVQEWRDYMADLCACLKEKLPFIESMEDHLQEFYDERASQLVQEGLEHREGQELADMASNAILETIAAEDSLDEAGRIAQIAVRDLERTYHTSDDSEVNEKAFRRGEKRKRRWQAAMHSASQGDYDVKKDSPLDKMQLASQLEEIKRTANEVFSDVLPEMRCISSITARVEGWKTQYSKLYDMAYIPDSLPALLAPFVRCEVLTWSPLCGTPLGLESQQWYMDVESFGGSEEDHLVPEIVRQVVLPVARQHIQKCWSPFVCSESKIVAEIVREMLVYVSIEDTEMEKLLRIVRKKLKEAVDDVGVSPYTRPAFSISEVVQSVVEVGFRRALHLTASLGCFTDILSRDVVRDLLLTELVCERLLPHLRALTSYQPRSAVEKVVSLLSLLPSPLLAAGQCPIEFQQISEVLRAMGRSIETQERPRKREEGGRAFIGSFVKWLFHFGKTETAISVQEAFLV